MSIPRISVVIPTFRRWDRLQGTLAALEAQTLPKEQFEVVVSDDGSGDGTMEQLQAYTVSTALRLKVVTGPNGGPSVARNRGWRIAQAPWIAFTDDDCFPEPGWLEAHLAMLEGSGGWDGSGGRVVRVRDSLISRFIDWTRLMEPGVNRQGLASPLITANAVYAKTWLERTGGFDEDFRWPGGEDAELSMRCTSMGARFGFVSEAVVRHMHRDTLRGLYRMSWHHGVGAKGLDEALAKAGRPRAPWKPKGLVLPVVRKVWRTVRPRDRASFAFLQWLRIIGFWRGYRAYDKFNARGTTSAN